MTTIIMTIADIHEVSIAKAYIQIFTYSWQVGARDVYTNTQSSNIHSYIIWLMSTAYEFSLLIWCFASHRFTIQNTK